MTDCRIAPELLALKDRLLAALIHHDGGAVHVKCVLEECEVERAPEQRAALGHHSLDHGTS